MKKIKTKWRIIAACIVVFLALTSYHKGPWHGTVVDAVTGKPLEGVVFVAVWSKDIYGSPGGPSTYYLDAEETVTDSKGEYNIPSKFYLSIPVFRVVLEPDLTFFKPGYKSLNFHYAKKDADDYLYMKVELTPLTNKAERLKSLHFSENLGPSVPKYKIRNFIHTVNIENRNLGLPEYPEAGQ